MKIKVALIGNMNNNFFSIMRYLRDLDIDAHLFMYESELALFKPENDTYYIEEYQEYIHTLPIKFSVKGLLFLKEKEIKEALEEYNFFIGSGLIPAIFFKLGIPLDIFIPHDDAIEYTINHELTYKNFLKIIAWKYVISLQTKGLKYNTKKLITSGIQEIMLDSIKRLELSDKYVKKYLLMVYREKLHKSKELEEIIEVFNKYDFIIFSHTRHIWHKKWITNELMEKYGGKGLDKLIIAYANFIKKNPNSNALLVFFEYGVDVDEAKAIIKEHNIEKHVLWLKQMPRKDILQLIDYADIVVDALSATMWGGVGWEALSRGKVLMQNIEQTDKEYEEEMGHPIPFIMRANSVEQVEEHLNNFINDQEYYAIKAKENSSWFDQYAGIGLAKEYKELILNLYSKK